MQPQPPPPGGAPLPMLRPPASLPNVTFPLPMLRPPPLSPTHGFMNLLPDPLFPPRTPAQLDAQVTEWASRCDGTMTCDLTPERSRWRYFAHDLVERQAARMWGTWQATTHDNVLLHESLGYMGYDVYVEHMDHGLDTYLGGVGLAQRAASYGASPPPVQHSPAPWVATLATSATLVRVRGSVGALLSYRLRGGFALIKTAQTDDGNPYHLNCLPKISVAIDFPAAGAANAPATGAVPFLNIGCDGSAGCQQCLQIYHLAGSGSGQLAQVWGAYDDCFPERVALAEVILRAWLCEEKQKMALGIGPYWARRRAMLSADHLHLRHRRFVHDTSSATVSGALGACADLGIDEVMGNQMGDDWRSEMHSGLGTHCALTHDMLWPYKSRLIELAYEHMAAHAPPGAFDPSSRDPSDLASVPSHELRAAIIDLASEVDEAVGNAPHGMASPLPGFNCRLDKIDVLTHRFSFVTKYPIKCGRALAGVGGHAKADAESRLPAETDPGIPSRVVFQRWLHHMFELLDADAEIRASGIMAPLHAARRRYVQSLMFDFEIPDEMRGGGEDGGPAAARGSIGQLVEMYRIARDAAVEAARLGLMIHSPCASKDISVCGWLHGRTVPMEEFLADVLMPLIVRMLGFSTSIYIGFIEVQLERDFEAPRLSRDPPKMPSRSPGDPLETCAECVTPRPAPGHSRGP